MYEDKEGYVEAGITQMTQQCRNTLRQFSECHVYILGMKLGYATCKSCALNHGAISLV